MYPPQIFYICRVSPNKQRNSAVQGGVVPKDTGHQNTHQEPLIGLQIIGTREGYLCVAQTPGTWRIGGGSIDVTCHQTSRRGVVRLLRMT